MSRILLLIPTILLSMAASAKSYDISLHSGRNYDTARFRLWHADTATTINAILVLMPGSNSDGRSEVEDAQWQTFAASHKLALLGCFFTDRPHAYMMAEEYMYAPAGSGDSLLKAIEKIASKTPFPHLANAPLLLWGMSAGGQFNYEFACWKPDRVIAFVVNKGGFYYTAMAPVATRQVPALFFTGEKDMEYRTSVVKGIYAVNRRIGACWAWAQEKGVSHEVGRSKELAIVWFDAILPKRFTSKPTDKPFILTPISQAQGMVGFAPNANFLPAGDWKTSDQQISSWLPDLKVAALWQELQQ